MNFVTSAGQLSFRIAFRCGCWSYWSWPWNRKPL